MFWGRIRIFYELFATWFDQLRNFMTNQEGSNPELLLDLINQKNYYEIVNLGNHDLAYYV